MNKSRSGFTIVELLIVIVVIGILAAITIVAFNGVQKRARDNTRSSDIASLQKALELYRVDHGKYPSYTPMGTNAPSGFTGRFGSSYSYSIATDDSWIKNLETSGVISQAPVDPINDTSHYYLYWSSGVNGYGACKEPFYVLGVFGYENGQVPANSHPLSCTEGTTVGEWGETSSLAIFSNIQRP